MTVIDLFEFLDLLQETMASPVRIQTDSSVLQLPRSTAGFAESPLSFLKREDEIVQTSEMLDHKPRPDASDRGHPGLYLSCFDMLLTEDAAWLVRLSDPSGPVGCGPRLEPEQCPVIDSPGLGTSPLSPTLEEQVEERSLEQVQSLVVGEVLKDIETACKLLNITPGEIFASYTTVIL